MLRVLDLTRVYRLGGEEVRALDGVHLEIRDGEYLRIVGASGSGKTTFLNLIAGLDRPTRGRIETPLGDLTSASPREMARWRSLHVGMVFQSFNLLPYRTAVQNVEVGLMFAGVPAEGRGPKARDALRRLGLGARFDHRPGDLSGGEQQRVALARAIAKDPDLLLADEPTGNLDRDNAAEIARLLSELNENGTTVVLVTHDETLAAHRADRTIRLSYGRIEDVIEWRAGKAHPR